MIDIFSVLGRASPAARGELLGWIEAAKSVVSAVRCCTRSASAQSVEHSRSSNAARHFRAGDSRNVLSGWFKG